MAGKISSASFGVLLVDGYDFLAAKVKTFTHKITGLNEPSTGLGDSVEAVLPTGLAKLEITQGGAFFDDATNGAHALLSPAAATQVSRLLVAAFAGNIIGRPFVGGSGVYGHTYDAAPTVAALTKANVGYTVSGTIDRGVIINALAAKTADWNTKSDGASVDYTTDTSQVAVLITSATKASPCVVTCASPHGLTTGQLILTSGNTLAGPSINSQQAVTVLSTTTFSIAVDTSGSSGAGTGGSFVRANTVNGLAGIQAVSAFSGFTGFVGKIRDSADDSTYADLISFTNVTSGPTAQRLTTSSTVNRYLSYNGDVTGTGSISVFVGATRL